MDNWKAPDGHPISLQRAKELMAGSLGIVYRDILNKSCAPIYWYRTDGKDRSILHNGTVTFIRTPERLLGVTAAHVLNAYLHNVADGSVRLQIMGAIVDDMRDRIVAMSERLDIATFAADENLLQQLNKEIVPLAAWPPRPPQEGRGIMLAGYPGLERAEGSSEVTFGLFTALVIARTVTDTQITWLIERDAQLPNAQIPTPPLKYGLGGISGGPLISWFEAKAT